MVANNLQATPTPNKLFDLKYKKFFEIVDTLDRLPLNQLQKMADKKGYHITILKKDGNRFLIYDPQVKIGWIRCSHLGQYMYCARRLWLQQQYGLWLTKQNLKAMYRGWLSHIIWQEKYGVGASELELVDYLLGIYGHLDAFYLKNKNYIVVELKSSWYFKPWHRLQVLAYLYLVERNFDVKSLIGHLIYRKGLIEIKPNNQLFSKYLLRIRKLFYEDQPPPVLPKKYRSRCKNCAYKFWCKKYPQGDWDKWLLPLRPTKCQLCDYRKFCLKFYFEQGMFPCESDQKSLIQNYLRKSGIWSVV